MRSEWLVSGGPAPEGARRVIAHVDADAFYASVHLREDPSLVGKPVVVAGSGPRSIVTTASYEARAFGIGSAQPAARARKLCPHAVFLTPNFPLYRRYSQAAMAIVRSYTKLVEPVSLDEAYLDITALERPITAMREMVEQIRAATGLSYSIGMGPNKLCAKVLSDYRKPAAFNVASREQCCELFAQHVPALIPGIGPKTAERLDAAGLTTIAAVRGASEAALAEMFGTNRGRELQARCRFEHAGAVQAERPIKSKSEETTFDEDIADLDVLAARMDELARDLCDRLVARKLRGRTIGIKVRLADFTTVTRARTVDDYTNAPETIGPIAVELLREYDPPQAVRLLGVRLASFEHERDEIAGDGSDGGRTPSAAHAATRGRTGSRARAGVHPQQLQLPLERSSSREVRRVLGHCTDEKIGPANV